MDTLNSIPERRLQHAVRRLLSNPSRVYCTADGQRIQVLAPGRLNVHEGPDFLDMAILIGPDVRVGSAEFHRNSSDWLHHRHDANKNYSSLVLHIVLDDDMPLQLQTPTLVLSAAEVREHLRFLPTPDSEVSLEDIHTYSLLRLLRLTAEHRELLETRTAIHTLMRSVHQYLRRYIHKRRRPAYSEQSLVPILKSIEFSPHARFVVSLEQGETAHIHHSLSTLIHVPIAQEGGHLRRELLVNSIVPCALAIAKDAARVNIFEWYWSVESLNDYGVLHRTFRGLSQKYLWQQQGMLEMLRERNVSPSAHDALLSYGLLQSLRSYLYVREPEGRE